MFKMDGFKRVLSIGALAPAAMTLAIGRGRVLRACSSLSFLAQQTLPRPFDQLRRALISVSV